jgi:hypothetical protein
MAPPPSSLGGSLVPNASHYPRPAQTGGKYKTTLGADLVPSAPPALPPDDDAKPAPADPAASKLEVGALVPRSAVRAEPPASPPAPRDSPRTYTKAVIPPPAAAPPPLRAPTPEVKRCMFTGDDLDAAAGRAAAPFADGAPVTAAKYQRWLGAQHAREVHGDPEGTVGGRASLAQRAVMCVYNQESLPRHPSAEYAVPGVAVRPPSASGPDALRVLRERKSKLVMPETLDTHAGFGKIQGSALTAEGKADWATEVAQRAWAAEQRKQDTVRRGDEVAREIANKAVSAYGERLPPRGPGELLAPFAPRRH